MNTEFSKNNVINSFIAPNSAWNIVRIKYKCEPNFFDVAIVHVVSLVSFIAYSFPISPSSRKKVLEAPIHLGPKGKAILNLRALPISRSSAASSHNICLRMGTDAGFDFVLTSI